MAAPNGELQQLNQRFNSNAHIRSPNLCSVLLSPTAAKQQQGSGERTTEPLPQPSPVAQAWRILTCPAKAALGSAAEEAPLPRLLLELGLDAPGDLLVSV